MDRNAPKEQFSYAYIQAVTSAAGYSVELKGRVMDNAGVDLTIEMPESGEAGSLAFPKLDVQVKCTSLLQKVKRTDSIQFSLPVQNYNRLRQAGTLVPMVLIVVLVPERLEDWIEVSEEQTLIKHCGYSISLEGWAATENRSNITIKIPRENIFTPESLTRIMQRIGRREKL